VNNTQKQNANIAAAKLLGYGYMIHYNLTDGDVIIEMPKVATRLFNIFTNPADCLDAVKMLGAIHAYSIQYYADQDGEHGWYIGSDCNPTSSRLFYTYEEAVAAACLVIGGKDE